MRSSPELDRLRLWLVEVAQEGSYREIQIVLRELARSREEVHWREDRHRLRRDAADPLSAPRITDEL